MSLNLSIGNVWENLSSGAKGWVVLFDVVLIAVAVAVTLLVSGQEPFIPINASLLPQRTVTDDLMWDKRNNVKMSLPSKWSPSVDIPMMSRIMIDNKLRGDELQKALNSLKNTSNPLNKFL